MEDLSSGCFPPSPRASRCSNPNRPGKPRLKPETQLRCRLHTKAEIRNQIAMPPTHEGNTCADYSNEGLTPSKQAQETIKSRPQFRLARARKQPRGGARAHNLIERTAWAGMAAKTAWAALHPFLVGEFAGSFVGMSSKTRHSRENTATRQCCQRQGQRRRRVQAAGAGRGGGRHAGREGGRGSGGELLAQSVRA